MTNSKNNTGNRNTGDYNAGHRNAGDYNTGNRNTGNRNIGNRNAGDHNTGDYNTGNYNTGDYNTGNRNTGHFNTGNRNTGNCNTGHFNTGNRNTGFFNTNEPNTRLFNKETNLKYSDINIPYIDLKLTELINGKLIKRTYKEAWKLAWDKLNESDKQKFLDLPNFCPDIFEQITGIDVRKKDSCDGKVVEIDGKKYKLTEL